MYVLGRLGIDLRLLRRGLIAHVGFQAAELSAKSCNSPPGVTIIRLSLIGVRRLDGMGC